MAHKFCYIAVYSHSGTVGGIGGSAIPVGVDGDVLRIAAAYDTYGSTIGGYIEVELYRRSVGNGKGEI